MPGWYGSGLACHPIPRSHPGPQKEIAIAAALPQRRRLTPAWQVLALRSIGRGADRIAKITSGADHVAALSERGRLYTWGSGLQVRGTLPAYRP